MGGCMLWLLRMLRYLAMFLDGSNTSCRSPNSFSYLLGNFSHVLRKRATGAKFRPLWGWGGVGEQSKEEETGKVKMRKQKKNKNRQPKEPYWTFLYSIYLFLTQRNQPVRGIFCVIGINAMQQLSTAVGELCGFSHTHAARHLSPVWLCSGIAHV